MGAEEKARAVIDTNVFISAILFGGLPAQLLMQCQKEEIIFLISLPILEEYIHTLSYPKFKLSKERIKEIIQEELLPFVEIVSVKTMIPLIHDDPDDNKFLECALDGRAGYIISGDFHVLKLKEFRGILVVTVKEFLEDRCD